MKRSPSARSLDLLRSQGYTAQLVESIVPDARRTKRDLFGFVDIVALRLGETLAVQTTDITNVSHRLRKIEDSEHVAAVRDAGWRIVVHGWHPDGRLREVDVS